MAGQISLMQMAIAGMAAISMTRLAGDWGLPFPVAPILAVVVAALVGVITGLPALRVRGVQLAVLTLGAGYAFENMVLGNAHILRESDASGSVPSPSMFGFDFGVNSQFRVSSGGSPSAWFGIFELLVLIACSAGIIWLRRSRLGLRFLAMRANERAATALGIDVARTKLAAFAIAAILAGITGVLSAYRFNGVTASQFVAMASVSAVALAYIGGISQISGTFVAGFLVAGGLCTVILDRLMHLGQFQPLITGVGLVIAAVLHPEGVAGAATAMRNALRTRYRTRSTIPASSATPVPRAPATSVEQQPVSVET
jgi:ABC-type branched-subunit amino acid transport system permease subunit